MGKVCTKMVPKNLTTEQKANRRDVCLDLLDRLERGARIPQSRYHRWWIMDFGVWPRDKMPKSGVAHCKLSPSQESENEQIQNQIDAHLFFLTVRGSSTRNLCHQDKLSIKLFIGKFLKYSGKGWHVCDQALNALGCCNTTTPHVTRQSPAMNFWQKKTFLWFLSPLFARSQSLWHLFIPPAQKPLERVPFWYFG